MTMVERRQSERKTLEQHAYINIEPNNVGMILNVSAGGLCFHSIDPVHHNGTIRFGLSGQKQRIEAEGVLVWSDETQKGGIRFTALSAVARDRVRNWLSQSATFSQPPAAAQSPGTNGDHPVPRLASTPERSLHVRLSGFSRGLATGLLLSVFVTAAFVFHGYRHEFGEWLIRTGERFAAKSQTVAAAAPTDAVSPPSKASPVIPPPVSRAAKTKAKETKLVSPVRKSAPIAPHPAPILQTKKARPQPEKVATQAHANSPTPYSTKANSVELAVAPTSSPVTNSSAKLNATSTLAALQPAAASTSATPVALASGAPKLDTIAKPLPASELATESFKSVNAPSTLEVFFEVGKFKNPLLAHDEADKVSRLGLPATAVHKHFLWASSYQVLVGPFSDEERAKTTHDTLVSNGFKPQTFEKGSRSLTLASTLSTDGGVAPEGDYVISWESYIGNASVKFLRNNLLVASANAKWQPRGIKYRVDSYVYRKNPNGSRTLLEIHFQGMRQALVFGRSS
jgi:hypothetical protein